LGFFHEIQAIQYTKTEKTIQELVPIVKEVKLVLHSCKEISNKYQIPHINKEKLERPSQLPLQIDCEASIVTATMVILAPANN
jgi:hypothetical protein